MINVKPILGIIGGSGVYEIDGLQNTRWEKVSSSFGEPSDSLFFGELDGQKLVFLPRHGRGHRIPPSEINYRANIDSLKRAGVTDVISVSAVGSLKEDLVCLMLDTIPPLSPNHALSDGSYQIQKH